MNKVNPEEKIIKKQEKVIKEIIKRYGENINLKKSPYLIAEIIREFSPVFVVPDVSQSGPVPGSHGTPPPPPPSPTGMSDPRDQVIKLTTQVNTALKKITQLEAKLKRGGVI